MALALASHLSRTGLVWPHLWLASDSAPSASPQAQIGFTSASPRLVLALPRLASPRLAEALPGLNFSSFVLGIVIA